jgi:hypothetical protein
MLMVIHIIAGLFLPVFLVWICRIGAVPSFVLSDVTQARIVSTSNVCLAIYYLW